MTTLPLPNNSVISADLSEEDAGHLADASINIDNSININDVDYKTDNINIILRIIYSRITIIIINFMKDIIIFQIII
jgi:hypothetical protein